MSSMLVNQHYILNKVSEAETHIKTRLYIDHLMKMLWAEAHRNLTIFPQE